MAAAQELTPSFLSVRGLRTTFPGVNGPVAAVDGIDFDMLPGEVLGIVGESGSGKSVTLRSLLHLVNPPADISGQVMWRGIDLMKLSEAELRLVRGREIAAIFQEPMAALNPVLTIGMQIEESLEYNLGLTSQAARPGRSSSCGWSGSPTPRTGSRPIPMNSPAACASAR